MTYRLTGKRRQRAASAGNRQDRTCDYVIVGAGSAGCTLAHRLTEEPDVRVVLLEAGGWDRNPWLHIPLAWGRNVLRRSHDWMYETEPSATMAGRRIPINRGRVIGGSSSINAMAYVRGHRGDYDRWSDHGLPDWSYAHVLPYFRRAETWSKGADDYRGDSGPLGVCHPNFPDPLLDAFIEAGVGAGHPTTPDYNGRQQEGFSRGQSTIREAAVVARRWPTCVPRWRGRISESRRRRSSRRSCSRGSAPSASAIGRTARWSSCAPNAR